jgi:hypothetical protein
VEDAMPETILTIRSLIPKVTVEHFEDMERENDFIKPTKKAIADLLTFIGHVRKLFDDKIVERFGILGWLNQMENVLKQIVASIDNYRLTVGFATNDANEELEAIEALLDSSDIYLWRNVNSILDKYPKSSGINLLMSLIEYWIKEIRYRGWIIHSLLNGSQDHNAVNFVFRKLEEMNSGQEFL